MTLKRKPLRGYTSKRLHYDKGTHQDFFIEARNGLQVQFTIQYMYASSLIRLDGPEYRHTDVAYSL